MENLEFYNKMKSVPPERLKKIQAGRLKGMSDINPQWRIEKLTEVFGPCGIGWKVSTPIFTYKEYGDEIVCNCEISLYIKTDKEWSEGIPGVGGSRFSTTESKGVYVSDEAQKMAFTDAISVAGKMLGLASDVYMGLSDSKYSAQKDGQGETKSKTDILLEAIEATNDVGELLELGKQIDEICVSDKQKQFFRNKANARYKALNKGDGEDLSKKDF